MRYTVSGKQNRHFELKGADSEVVLAKLDHLSWFSRNAEICLASGEVFRIELSGFWRRKIILKKGEEQVCEVMPRISGKGRMDLQMADGSNYSYKHKSLFKQQYGLYSDTDHELIAVSAKFSFAMLGFTYAMETDDNYKEANDAALLLLLVYCTNYMRIQHSAH